MSIKPIDIQVLIGQLDRVSHQQMIQEKAENKRQTLQGEKLVKNEIQRDHSVNESSTSPEKASIPSEKKREKKEKRNEKILKQKLSSSTLKDRQRSFKESNLGQIVDIIK